MIYVRLFGNPILILNSATVASDLLDKRGAKYSSRPVRTMVNELMGWDWLFSSMPYGQRWRSHRALFQQHYHSNRAPAFQPLQLKEAYTLLHNLAQDPDRFAYYVRRSAAAVVMMISYGHQIVAEGDLYVTLADDALGALGKAGIFGSYLVDYLPFLKHVPEWCPGACFKRQAREWRKLTRAMVDIPFTEIKQKMAAGTALPCVASLELEKTDGTPDSEELIKDVAAIGYAETVSAILSFFLAVSISPAVQKRAHDQLDQVLGGQRLPTFEDRPSLPYIDCILWECLRWNPVTPMGLAHYLTEDDEYDGYTIPKGTTVLPNVWCMLHDEKRYPHPLEFKPERFENAAENKKQDVISLPWEAFGFGRRMCPGRWLAIDQIWISIACVLAVFDISKPLDNDGHPIEPNVKYTSSQLSRPEPFNCRITPRSERAISLIKQLSTDGTCQK
ncbi:cytochrome P450 [Gloeophyllum trabeum ATCC 11539]|uniref:Cytochrome P450 n=1 Tax=Gloeophyllum trabeum (strain ATCC 11539 / FP-39264 / Madison 617) TaxID=670483 RepID=S7S4B0_GLOTA|nr:cytochrome P450 [Gloeophyllum trabeum ATCC 11539]EPQ60724.1 cytochrome P450 [Gloeophyllum trabeum ATCC 11539]